MLTKYSNHLQVCYLEQISAKSVKVFNKINLCIKVSIEKAIIFRCYNSGEIGCWKWEKWDKKMLLKNFFYLSEFENRIYYKIEKPSMIKIVISHKLIKLEHIFLYFLNDFIKFIIIFWFMFTDILGFKAASRSQSLSLLYQFLHWGKPRY